MADTEQLINDAETINNFLGNESIRRVFQAYDEFLYKQWKHAFTPAQREEIYAKASAFDGFADALRAIVDSGKRETHDLEAEERANRTDLP